MSIKGMQRTVFVTELKRLQPDISEASLRFILDSIIVFESEAGRAGWISSAKEYGAFYMYQTEVEEEANQYAESVKTGEK